VHPCCYLSFFVLFFFDATLRVNKDVYISSETYKTGWMTSRSGSDGVCTMMATDRNSWDAAHGNGHQLSLPFREDGGSVDPFSNQYIHLYSPSNGSIVESLRSAICNGLVLFSSTGWANSITGEKLPVYVSVCVLTRVTQIIIATRRDL